MEVLEKQERLRQKINEELNFLLLAVNPVACPEQMMLGADLITYTRVIERTLFESSKFPPIVVGSLDNLLGQEMVSIAAFSRWQELCKQETRQRDLYDGVQICISLDHILGERVGLFMYCPPKGQKETKTLQGWLETHPEFSSTLGEDITKLPPNKRLRTIREIGIPLYFAGIQKNS